MYIAYHFKLAILPRLICTSLAQKYNKPISSVLVKCRQEIKRQSVIRVSDYTLQILTCNNSVKDKSSECNHYYTPGPTVNSVDLFGMTFMTASKPLSLITWTAHSDIGRKACSQTKISLKLFNIQSSVGILAIPHSQQPARRFTYLHAVNTIHGKLTNYGKHWHLWLFANVLAHSNSTEFQIFSLKFLSLHIICVYQLYQHLHCSYM